MQEQPEMAAGAEQTRWECDHLGGLLWTAVGRDPMIRDKMGQHLRSYQLRHVVLFYAPQLSHRRHAI